VAIMQDFFLRIGLFKNAEIPTANVRGRDIPSVWLGRSKNFDRLRLSRAIDPVSFNNHTFGFTIYF